MREFGLFFIVAYLVVCLTRPARGLKCRTTQEGEQNNDLEFVVRMCLRRMNNESDFMAQLFGNSNHFDLSGDKRQRKNTFRRNNNNNNNNYANGNRNMNNMNSNNNNYNDDGMDDDNNEDNGNQNNYDRNQDRRSQESNEKRWPSNRRPNYDRDGFWKGNQRKPNGDYYDESDNYYNHYDPRKNEKDERNKYKSTLFYPNNQQQQMQHDRDVTRGQVSHDSSNYFYYSMNQNKNSAYDGGKKNDSPLADVEPCVIHCVFQEMQMVDESGNPNKELISQKMTQKIRNPELRTFIQDSVEECFENIEKYDFGNYSGRKNGNQRRENGRKTCDWAKNFAMCLEDRGKDNCEDWNDPIQRNSGNNTNSTSTNNKNNNNNKKNNTKNNEGQKNKSKQNDRG